MEKKAVKKAIAALLQRNARISDGEIADRLELKPEQVKKIIGDMEQDRTIFGYSALLNEEKLGDGKVRAIIEVSIQPERDSGYERVAREISKFPEVRTVYLVSGGYDLGVEVEGVSLQEVAFFVASKLAPLDGVRATVTHFLLKRYKTAGFTLQEDEKHERLQIVP